MSTEGRPPNYYAILEIPETASTTQIRDAYKRAALKTHPDRVPSDSPERPSRTRKFQLVNDAYFTLSDPSRRREYDAQRKLYTKTSSSSSSSRPNPPNNGSQMPGGFDPFADADQASPGAGAAPNGFSWAWNFFTNRQGADPNANQEQNREQAENEQFADVFEEMLREEGMADGATSRPTGKFWGMIGGVSGAALGFIVANVPGLVAGAVAGNRLGAVRDVKGKSVYAVFQELPQDDKAKLLSQLAAKVFSHAVGI